jgi:hypothetical protein
MVRSWLFTIAILTGLALSGCVIPAEVREKVAVEAKIHQGYERFVDVAPIESLRAIIRKSSKSWTSLDAVVNPSTDDVTEE